MLMAIDGTGRTGIVRLCGRSERPGLVWRVTRGFLLLCSYVFLEDEARQQGGGLLHRQVVEEAVENHLRQQELVAARDTDAGRYRPINQPLQFRLNDRAVWFLSTC